MRLLFCVVRCLIDEQRIGELLEGHNFSVLQLPDVCHSRLHFLFRGAVSAVVGPHPDDLIAAVNEAIGTGQNSLEKDLTATAAAHGRTVTPDAHPEKGLVYRADHFSLSKRGVPTLLLMAIGGGPDLLDGGRAAGDKWVDDYTANCYHKACDAWSADWDLRGAEQDIELAYDIGRKLADSGDWPQWNDGSEFKTVRAASDGLRRK